MVHFTLWPSRVANKGGHTEIDWPTFRDFVANPQIAEDKNALEGWSPAKFTGDQRGVANVEAVSAIGLDDDESGLSLERVCEIWSRFAGLVHTTHSHDVDPPGCRKYRIILRTTRDVTASEYSAIWRVVRAHALQHGQTLDEQPKDSARFWYVPARRAGAAYGWHELNGAPLDVDAILAAGPPDVTTPRVDASRLALAQAGTPDAEPGQRTAVGKGAADRRNAMAAALGASWPATKRHEAQLALAGALKSEGFTEAEAVEFLCAVCRAAGNEDRPKREATVRHTYARTAGDAVTGWTRLKSLVDPVVVDAARGALGRDAEWTERAERRLAEVAAADTPTLPTATDGTIAAGPFVFKVGGLDADLPPIVWAIDGMVCKADVVMLVAHGGSLKTWLAFSLALAIATGRPWLGRFVSLRGRSAIISFEDGDFEVARRLKMLGAKDSEIDGRLLRCSYSGAQLTDPDTWVALAELGLDLIVVDSFNAAQPETDENDARSAVLLQHAGKFANATGCTVIVIHHARKGSGGDQREVVRGSTALFAACDRIFKFTEPEKLDGGRVLSVLHSVKDGAGRTPVAVKVELSDQGLRFVEEAAAPEEKPEGDANREIVFSTLKARPSGVAKDHLVNVMKGKREKKFELLSQLALAGITVEYRDSSEKNKTFIMLKPGTEP